MFAATYEKSSLFVSRVRIATIKRWRFYCPFSDVPAVIPSDEKLRRRSGGNGLAEPIHLISRKLWLDGMTCNDVRKPRRGHVASRGSFGVHLSGTIPALDRLAFYRTKVPIKVIATRLSRPPLTVRDCKCNWCDRRSILRSINVDRVRIWMQIKYHT